MRSVYPDDILRHVLQRLDVLDVVEYLDYHPESMQRDRGKLRMFCPIHGETSRRTLSVNLEARTYRCSEPDCPGAAGGDLIDLVARTQRTDYDSTLRRLVEEFAVEVELPRDQESVNRALVEAENLLVLVSMHDERSAENAGEAHARLDRVLEENPHNPLALRLKFRLLQENGADASEVAPWIVRLVELEVEAGNDDEAREAMETELVRAPGNLVVRRRLAEFLRHRGESSEATEHYLLLAETAEMAGDLAAAIHAYREIQSLGETGFDASAMITQLLLATDDRESAIRELLGQAQRARTQGDPPAAAQALATAMEIDPENARLAVQLVEAWAECGPEAFDLDRALELCDRLIERRERKQATTALETLAKCHRDSTEVLARLVRLHRQEGMDETAAELLRRVAQLHREAQRHAEARDALDELLKILPHDAAALRLYAEIAEEQGDTEAAIVHYRTLAQVCNQSGNGDGAMLATRKMYEVAPSDRKVVSEYAALLVKLDRRKDAIAVLEEATERFSPEHQTEDLRALAEYGLQLDSANAAFLFRLAAVVEQEGDRTRALELALDGCRELLREGRAEDAERRVRELISRRGTDATAVELLADALVACGRGEDAIEELHTAAARLLEGGGDKEAHLAAAALMEKVNVIDPHDHPALERLVEIHEARDDRAQALWAHERLMLLFKQLRRYPEAIHHGRRILALDPNHVEGHRELIELYKLNGEATSWKRGTWRLARLYRDKGEVDLEKKVLRETLEEDPSDLDARERLVELVALRHDATALSEALRHYVGECEKTSAWTRAAEFLRAFDEREPGNPVIQRTLIEVLEKTNETRERSARLRNLIEQHEKQNENDEAVELCGELVRLRPYVFEHREHLIALLLKGDRTAEAAAALVDLARERMNDGALDDAATDLERAVALDSTCTAAHSALAEIAVARGRDDRAIGHLLDCAQCLTEAGRHEEALEVLDRATALHPRNLTPRRRRVAILLNDDLGRTGEALAELDSLASEQLARGDEEAGFQLRREALEIAPEDAERRRDLARQLDARGRRPEAVHALLDGAEHALRAEATEDAAAWCAEALDLEPNDLRGRSLNAEILERSGRRDEALAEWRALGPLLRSAGRESSSRNPAAKASAVPVLPLMEEYSFDRFVVGDRNRFAWATARAIAQAPGRTPHNPLFIHADVGLGKTHLLHAVANSILAGREGLRVVYTSAEDFTTELIEAIQYNTVGRFRQRYKEAGLLLLDDVHFLAGKERAQEEFFHIFNALYQGGSQIIVTSDRPPSEISRLEKRLVSRFGAGVIVDIQCPEMETRLAILRRTCDEMPDVNIPNDVLAQVAESVSTNVRDLKAVLNQLIMLNRAGGRTIDLEVAREAIRRRMAEVTVPSGEAAL